VISQKDIVEYRKISQDIIKCPINILQYSIIFKYIHTVLPEPSWEHT